jgi:cation:H+ antiporter
LRIGSLSTSALVLVLVAAAVATWIAGTALSRTTDVIDRRFGLGDALGGLILLAIAGSLPELAITISAAASGHLSLAAGNLIGGIAMQTMVLVVCDAVASRSEALTYLVGSLIPVLEGLTVVTVVGEVLMGALLPARVSVGPVSPASIVIVVSWLVGLYTVDRVRRAPAWEIKMPGSRPGRPHRRAPHPREQQSPPTGPVGRSIVVFAVAAAVTLGAGVALEAAGATIASRAHVNGVIFGATVLAFATSLPEISSGIAAVRLGDHGLAVADIFGGNAFQVCLFLVADLVAGQPVLPASGDLNGWLAALGVVLTVVYAFGVIVRRRECRLRLGLDSWIAIAAFSAGMAGLYAVSHG